MKIYSQLNGIFVLLIVTLPITVETRVQVPRTLFINLTDYN